MEEMTRCSRCGLTKLQIDDFDIKSNGEHFKSCRKCTQQCKQRKDNNREAIRQQAREHYQEIKEQKAEQVNRWRLNNIERLTARIACECGGNYQYRSKAEHFKTTKHQKYIESSS